MGGGYTMLRAGLLLVAACHRTHGSERGAYVVGDVGSTCTSLGLCSGGGPEECRAAAGELPAAAETTGRYAGEWSDGDGTDWGNLTL